MREMNWMRLRKVIPYIVIAPLAYFYLFNCQGPFWDSSECQAVSPTGQVKVMLIHGGPASSRISPPYYYLVLENRDWRYKPSGICATTMGEFVNLRWTQPRRLEVTGKRLEKDLLAKPMIMDTMDGDYEVDFVEVGAK